MRVLVTGAAGLLGTAVTACFQDHGDQVVCVGHAALDITEAGEVSRVVADERPDAIVNCAAYNNVDAAERDPQSALAVNALGVLALAHAARAAGATLVHYGTDFVFDGETTRPYEEQDPPNPRSTYGASKLVGEWFAAAAPRHYVLRVESLFGGPGVRLGARRGSLGTIVDRIRAAEVVPVFVDRTISPSYTRDVAETTRTLLERGAEPGLYHCVNAGSASWREVAEEAARILGTGLRIRELTLESIAAPAKRPRFCAMASVRLASLGITMPPWQDAVRRYLANDIEP